MRLLKLQFRRVLAGMMRSSGVDIVRQAVEQGRLARTVPPEMTTLQRTRPMILRTSAPSCEIEPKRTSCSRVSLSFLNYES